MKQLSIFLFFCFLLQKPNAQNKLFFQPDTLSQFLENYVSEGGFPGFGVAILKGDTVLYQKAFGFADLQQKQPYTAQTLQPIGSISKTTIGFALQHCVEKGYFTLETPIDSLLPFKVVNPRNKSSIIRIKHLATHTSGIHDNGKNYLKSYYLTDKNAKNTADPRMKKWLKEGFFSGEGVAEMSLENYLRAYLLPKGKFYSKKNFSKKAAGEVYDYSNIGAALAGLIIEKVVKMPYSEFSKKLIFEKLGMKNSAWKDELQTDNMRATLYDAQHLPYPKYALASYPDGGVRINLEELTQYLQETYRSFKGKSSVLKSDLGKNMFAAQFSQNWQPRDIDPRSPNSGVFWSFAKNGNIGHSGSDPGCMAFMFFDPKTGYGRIFMSNMDLEDPKHVAMFKEIWAKLIPKTQP